jgi:hypothetical protein
MAWRLEEQGSRTGFTAGQAAHADFTYLVRRKASLCYAAGSKAACQAGATA